jgi:hypothetical protein
MRIEKNPYNPTPADSHAVYYTHVQLLSELLNHRTDAST